MNNFMKGFGLVLDDLSAIAKCVIEPVACIAAWAILAAIVAGAIAAFFAAVS